MTLSGPSTLCSVGPCSSTYDIHLKRCSDESPTLRMFCCNTKKFFVNGCINHLCAIKPLAIIRKHAIGVFISSDAFCISGVQLNFGCFSPFFRCTSVFCKWG